MAHKEFTCNVLPSWNAHEEWSPAKHKQLAKTTEVVSQMVKPQVVITLQTYALHEPIANVLLTFLNCTVVR